MAGRPKNANLEIAKLAGDKTYIGSVHDACGTNERYTSGGGCVFCARMKQTEMRNALAASKAKPLTGEQDAGISAKEPWE